MKRTLLLMLLAMFAISMYAKSPKNRNNEQEKVDTSAVEKAKLFNVETNQQFCMYVYDNNGSALNISERDRSARGGYWGSVWKAMKTGWRDNALDVVGKLSGDLISTAIDYLVEKLRSKKKDWMQQVRKDCSFTRKLPMQQSISDFYEDVSSRGALDPDGIIFNGFGCKQFIVYKDTAGKEEHMLAFKVKCSLKADSVGKARILHHGKFEVVLDTLIINPYLCNLPNDSLTAENVLECRTPFDFMYRKDFKFSLDAEVTSSWMNEAIQIYQDQKLGSFNVSACIPDSTYLSTDKNFPGGYFVYVRDHSDSKIAENVSVSGDCFIVPRSYIGNDAENGYNPVWGTGQYKINMVLTEACDINEKYYWYKNQPEYPEVQNDAKDMPKNVAMPMSGSGDKIKHHWQDEWKRIERRHRISNNYWKNLYSNVKMRYGDNKWINIITDPMTTSIINENNTHLKKHLDELLKIGDEEYSKD